MCSDLFPVPSALIPAYRTLPGRCTILRAVTLLLPAIIDRKELASWYEENCGLGMVCEKENRSGHKLALLLPDIQRQAWSRAHRETRNKSRYHLLVLRS